LLAFGAIYFLMRRKITFGAFSSILTILILLDLGLVDSRYLNDSVYKKIGDKSFLDKTPADDAILKDTDINYRVLNLQNPFNEARTSYFHKSLGGYHGAKIRRYQDIISLHLAKELQQIIQDKGLDKDNSGVISMLNAKYLLAGYQTNSVIPNPYANGAAWIVDEINLVNSPDEEIEQIGIVDLRTTAVIDQNKFETRQIRSDTLAQIKLIDYQPNKLVYESESVHNIMAVFSEIYYSKGWKAYIDGNEAEILRANYILRALELQEGKHNIEFRFEPRSFYIGNMIMWISSVVLLGILLFMLIRKFYFQKQQ
ncbi:MAG: YfhO family protein, partial [Cyclobacteriaceae bacterium]|nr:YfhO family protein [Cyclobacteriaceae bacterium]